MEQEDFNIRDHQLTSKERDFENALRPLNFEDFSGQDKVVDNLRIFVKAARLRGEALDHVLLHGPPGLGKTTLSNIIANELGVGFKITSGPVLDKPGDLAGVPLFDESVMENIRLGRSGASDEDVRAAAKAAQCDEFIDRLPQGYDTNIGENGSKLSGGERQRISIARALLKNAPVILLDEATASMDAESETMVQTALSALLKGRTVIVIAHRMRTIANADKIVVLDKGKVTEVGTPSELAKKGGLYAHLVALQQKQQMSSLPT